MLITKTKNYKNLSIIIFLSISLLYAVGNFVWWYLNTPIVCHGYSALHFLDIFQDTILYNNAPLITWIMKCLFFVFGKHYFDLQIIILNYILFSIALYFIYKIGFELKDKETGNIAMILFALTPAVYIMSRQYGHQDWHVMIAMVVNIYCLIKLDDFKYRKWSILYGITVGLGLLIKDEFLPYFFTPWLYTVIKSLIEKVEIKKIINILITIILGSLISGCHYFRCDIINKILHEPIRETVNIFTCENIRMMTLGLSDDLLSPILFIVFLIGFIWFVISFSNKNKWNILLWILIPWLIILFMPHRKEPEYNIGYIPAIILIISLFISNIKNKTIKFLVLFISIFILLLQFFNLSYKKISLIDRFNYYNRHNLMFYDDTDTSALVELIENLEVFKNKKIFIFNTNSYILQIHTLLAFMALNEFNVCFDISEADVVISNGKEKTLEELAQEDFALSNIAYFADNNAKNDFINERIEVHKKVRDILMNNFHLYKSWYLQNIKEEKYFVRLYTNKET